VLISEISGQILVQGFPITAMSAMPRDDGDS
jgi:hypothetical protein